MELERKRNTLVNNDRPEIGIGQTPILRNWVIILMTHTAGPIGLYLLFQGKLMWQTSVFFTLIGYFGGFGTTAGAHRLWAHQSYKAKTPLKILLIIAQTLMGQESLLYWVMDHRVHHKYTETDADPYDAKRGFWFSHIGWLVDKKKDAVLSKLKTIDISDLEKDPIVMFQHKYYYPIAISLIYIIPIYIACTCWGESLFFAYIVANTKYLLQLHFTFLVNSAAHLWGYKPYDKNIGPVESWVVSIFAAGEGWHNYHHVFPWDYKAAELGSYGLNWTTGFIDFFAWMGWAYDLKTVSQPMIDKRAGRTGDGTRNLEGKLNGSDHHHHHENPKWGWGDRDISEEDVEVTKTLFEQQK